MLSTGNTAEAEQKLLRMPGLANFLCRLLHRAEKKWFRQQFRSYIEIFHPKCPFEIVATNRYDPMHLEAAVIARESIRTGERVDFLVGTTVRMTKEEELSLRKSGRNFSVVQSSYRKANSVLLGPVRFVNHDCDPNCRLVTLDPRKIFVEAQRNIKVGDEITLFYSSDYFGDGNRECLCATCKNECVHMATYIKIYGRP